MKILHINSIPYGGAYRAAFRIHEAILKSGIDSQFWALEQIQDRLEYAIRKKNPIVQKFQWRMRHHFNWELYRRRKILSRFQSIAEKLTCETASLPVSNIEFFNQPEVREADLIHLHWISRHFDYIDFFTTLNKPIVWTLHDMNAFTGLFHYHEDANRNKVIGGSLDRYLTILKSRLINNYKYPISIITPSTWLAREAKKSKAFRHKMVSVIPYALDMQEFTRKQVNSLRQQLNLSRETKVLLAVAESTFNYRKGFDILLEAVQHFPDVKLLLVGVRKPDSCHLPNAIYTGSINDNELLSQYYSLADATVIPSREDNLPNVMLESLACGTPVISFRVGGMPDHIKNFQTGMMADEMTSESLAKTISLFYENRNRFDSSAIREYAESHFNEKLVAEKYIEVYNQLLHLQ